MIYIDTFDNTNLRATRSSITDLRVLFELRYARNQVQGEGESERALATSLEVCVQDIVFEDPKDLGSRVCGLDIDDDLLMS